MTKPEKIVSKPGFLTITLRESPSYLYFAWENFGISLDACVEAFTLAEKAMVERGVFYIVSDIANAKDALRPEVAKWWGEVCMPSLAKLGVKLILQVVPPSLIAQQPAENGDAEVVNGIVMQKARSVSEGESLLLALQGGKIIEKEQFIKATPLRVFKALTEKEELEKWFVQKADLQLTKGGHIRIEWAPGMAEHGEIKQVQPSELISFTWEAFSPTPTTVTLKLKEDREGTLLRLTHGGIGEGEQWGDYYANISKGWTAHLKDLTSWIETGACPPPGPRG
jgi:uncharacterized protein YndB with AHSA1/START domain